MDAVLRNLMDRRGIKVEFHILQDEDPATFEEMRSELVELVGRELAV